jgi:hypothetical protein
MEFLDPQLLWKQSDKVFTIEANENMKSCGAVLNSDNARCLLVCVDLRIVQEFGSAVLDEIRMIRGHFSVLVVWVILRLFCY